MAFSSFYDQIESNKRKTYFLFFIFFGLVAVLGLAFGFFLDSFEGGVEITLIIGVVYALIVYFQGANMLLSVTGAQPASKEQYAYLINTVEGLAIAAGIPTPQAYVIEDPSPNAFATGRNPKNSYIAVTTGLLQKMNKQELEGVIAHEMSHIQNYDIQVSLYAIILVGLVGLLSGIFLRMTFLSGGRGGGNRDREGGAGVLLIIIAVILAIIAPIIAQLIRLAISRQREYLADANGARLTRYPEGLASALEKISADPVKLKRADETTSQLYISDPLKGKLSSWFSTHPPIEDRIKRLRSM